MGTPGWPAELTDGGVRVRPLRRGDARVWAEVRSSNVEWLAPWESTLPYTLGDSGAAGPAAYRAMVSALRRQAKAGSALPFAVDLEGQFVGQVTVSTIIRGSLQSASVGYWVDQRFAGRGIIPVAVALVVDHCFHEVGLHRIELNVRPENTRSRRVAEKLGFRDEGVRTKYLHIDRSWRDHVCYALTVEDVPRGVLRAYLASQTAQQ
jgi:ribosomal-protein-alanine N-acetyltransferase